MAFRFISTPDSQKFSRYFVLKVETALDTIARIEYPLTCEFNVTRNNLASVNSATFTIYNLNETTRLSLFKDPYDINTFRLIEFYAGYYNETTLMLPLVFKGSVKQCYSERSGCDYKTVIECFDGQQGMASSFASQTLPPGTSIRKQYAALIETMKDIQGGTIGNIPGGESKRGVVQFGNPADIMKQLTNIDFYVDRLVCYALDQSDVLVGDLPIINADSGILDVPKKTETSVTMTLLFEPRLQVSQLLKIDIKPRLIDTTHLTLEQALSAYLNSVDQGASIYNGEYKLTGISHQGTISGAICGDCRTTLNLLSLGGTVPVYRVVPDDNEFLGVKVIVEPSSVK
jgi:hypothetical protein